MAFLALVAALERLVMAVQQAMLGKHLRAWEIAFLVGPEVMLPQGVPLAMQVQAAEVVEQAIHLILLQVLETGEGVVREVVAGEGGFLSVPVLESAL